jgi:hypothetical protein
MKNILFFNQWHCRGSESQTAPEQGQTVGSSTASIDGVLSPCGAGGGRRGWFSHP